jgi:predicted transcriptional regulator
MPITQAWYATRVEICGTACYSYAMNAKLQNLFERIAALPDELLGEIEQSIDEIERWRGDVFRLTDEERAAVRKGMEAARRGEFVTDEELAAFYRRHGG